MGGNRDRLTQNKRWGVGRVVKSVLWFHKQPHCEEGSSMAKVKNVDFVVYFLQGVPQARLPCLRLFTTLGVGTDIIGGDRQNRLGKT